MRRRSRKTAHDADASAVMRVSNADLGALTEKLVHFLDNELKRLVIDNGAAPKLRIRIGSS
jgi:hypothetical protein